jgi:beta-glucosidase
MKYTFPENFLWGTATAAHQIEGNNKNSDWWEWEQSKKYPPHVNPLLTEAQMADLPDREWPLEPSLLACDSYNRYEEDFEICKKLNNNAVRISIEWARIEPEEGSFNDLEIEHYKKVLQSAKSKGLKTFVTLHHFTNPRWFFAKGGWINPNAPKRFARYAKKCAEEFGDLIDVYLTINEPQVYTVMSYVWGVWPPARRSWIEGALINFNLIRCHRAAYDAIKLVNSNFPVGIVKHIVWCQTGNSQNFFMYLIDKIMAEIKFFAGCDFFLLPLGKKNDLIGINYYFTETFQNMGIRNKNDWVSDLGWWVNPEGLEKILIHLKKYNVPLYVTENGIADSKDETRKDFLREMIVSCAKALAEGVNLKGYFYWSLLDNYEWHQGYWPEFGVVHVDRKNNLKRTIRQSGHYYSEICRTNSIESDKLK